MIPDKKKLPYKISEYITDHFKEDFLFEVKSIKEIRGQVYYMVDVSKDDQIYHLRFNEKGNVVAEDAEEAFPPDIHEEPTGGDVPE